MTEENNIKPSGEDNPVSSEQTDSSTSDGMSFSFNFTDEQKKLIKYIIIFLILMYIMYQVHQREIYNCITFYEEVIRNQSLSCVDSSRYIFTH